MPDAISPAASGHFPDSTRKVNREFLAAQTHAQSLALTANRVMCGRRSAYAALGRRIQVRVHLTPVCERERFARLSERGCKRAGCTQTLLTNSRPEILRQASKGLPRHAARICVPPCVW